VTLVPIADKSGAHRTPAQSCVRPNAAALANGWRFVTAPGVDELLMGRFAPCASCRQTLYLVVDGQGRQLAVGDSSGFLVDADFTVDRGAWQFAGATQNGSTFDANRMGSNAPPAISYFRNRSYDSRTGRWKQEDPMGMAGALNVYQFNGNNPVTFTDPFGLESCPRGAGGDGKTEQYDDCEPGTSGWYAHRLATGQGSRALNNIGGTLATCGESGTCKAVLAVGGLASAGLKLLAGRAVVAAASAGTDAAATEGGSAVEITFQSAHGARHLVGTGLQAGQVEAAIGKQVSSEVSRASFTGNFWGRIPVAGQTIEYRAFNLPSGAINIGPYYPVP